MEISEAARRISARMNDCCGSCVVCEPDLSDACDEDAVFCQSILNEVASGKNAEIEQLRAENKCLVDVLGGLHVYLSDTLSGPAVGSASAQYYLEGIIEVFNRVKQARSGDSGDVM